MRVAAEHLLVHVLDLILKALWEAGSLSKPMIGIARDLLR